VQVLQLYIEGQQIELFDDESVKMTQSIKDVRDIAKVFTEFTKTFTVPASKENNKVFVHYYNPDIVGGFDARKKKSAEITLNYAPFKKGKIKLDSIEMKNNKPYSYKITFFGNTIQLKDLLGEDKLSDIEELDNNLSSGELLLNFPTYNSSMIYNGMRRDPSSNDFIVPLITHTQRLFYDSIDVTPNIGNLFYTIARVTGVEFNNLKPAIRVHRIIEEIENKYNLTFSTDFFNSTQTDYYMLFMWLHRKKGALTSGDSSQRYPNTVDVLQPPGIDNTEDLINRGSVIEVTQDAVDNLSDCDINLTRTGSGAYALKILRNDVVIYSENEIDQTLKSVNHIAFDGGFKAGDYKIVIEVLENQSVSFSNIEFTYTNNDAVTDTFDLSTTFTANSEFEFKISDQIPEMKVIDFLTGIFKMFNLVAYVDDNDVIVVKPLDDYYADSDVVVYDISEYVDVEQTTTSPSLPFKEIHFGYKDTDTVLAKNHKQFFNEDWGEAEYDGSENDATIDNNIYGGIYKVEVPFHHAKYEHLINLGSNLPVDIQYGYFVDDNFDAYFGKPLLFYPIYDTSAQQFSLVEVEADESYSIVNNFVANTTPFNIPSNTLEKDYTTAADSLHFSSYPSEWDGESNYEDTLFKKYYRNYIRDIFEPINRMIKIKAYLPIKILQKLKMNDRIVINDRQHRINKITSNLKTGESQIELLND